MHWCAEFRDAWPAEGENGEVAAAHVLVVDNFDSFVFNLVDELESAGATTTVVRSDAMTLDQISELHPDAFLLSPGPKRPEDAELCLALLTELSPTVPTFGVCLGHQCIGTAFGATVGRAPAPVHGKTVAVAHDGTGVFDGVANPMTVTRYHSLVIHAETVPPELEVLATTHDEEQLVMAVRHRTYPIIGVQFHPESVLTAGGTTLIRNWLATI